MRKLIFSAIFSILYAQVGFSSDDNWRSIIRTFGANVCCKASQFTITRTSYGPSDKNIFVCTYSLFQNDKLNKKGDLDKSDCDAINERAMAVIAQGWPADSMKECIDFSGIAVFSRKIELVTQRQFETRTGVVSEVFPQKICYSPNQLLGKPLTEMMDTFFEKYTSF